MFQKLIRNLRRIPMYTNHKLILILFLLLLLSLLIFLGRLVGAVTLASFIVWTILDAGRALISNSYWLKRYAKTRVTVAFPQDQLAAPGEYVFISQATRQGLFAGQILEGPPEYPDDLFSNNDYQILSYEPISRLDLKPINPW